MQIAHYGKGNAIFEMRDVRLAPAVSRHCEAFNNGEHIARSGDDVTSGVIRAIAFKQPRNGCRHSFTCGGIGHILAHPGVVIGKYAG